MRKSICAIVSVFSLYLGFAQKDTSLPLYLSLSHLPKRSNVLPYLTKKAWDSIFPHRFCMETKNCPQPNHDFYSYTSFVNAAKLFPKFLNEGPDSLRLRELAAFLAHISQETSGGWASAPGGYFKWGLCFLEEQNQSFTYADTSNKNYPPVAGVSYIGRGPKQLSWNYNYGQFSEAWYGTKDSLLLHPERLAQDPIMAFASAIWFWMTPQFPKPSCHDIMLGTWQPTAQDSAKGRLPGFGATVNVVNGGVECGKATDLDKTIFRYQYFQYFCRYFLIAPGKNIFCNKQIPFGK